MSTLDEILDSISRVSVIAGGHYGCVFLLTLHDGRQYADKVEFINPDTTLDQVSEEMKVHRLISDLVQNDPAIAIVRLILVETRLGLPQSFYDTTKEYMKTRNANTASDRRGLRHAQVSMDFCYSLYRHLETKRKYKSKNAFSEGPLVSHTIMEYANHGTLRDFVLNLVKNKKQLDLNGVLRLSFPLLWAFKTLWNQTGFVHGDIRMLNIVLDSPDEPMRVLYKDMGKRQRWTLKFDSNWPLPKLTDFGHSMLLDLSNSKSKGLYSPTSDPRNMFVNFPLLCMGAIDTLENDMWNDMWSFSLLMLEMVIYPYIRADVFSLHKLAHKRSGMTYNLFADAFKHLLFHLLYNMSGGYSELESGSEENRNRRLSILDSRATVLAEPLIAMCLLNHELGNGLVPDRDDIDGLADSSIYNLFLLNEETLIEMATQTSETTTNIARGTVYRYIVLIIHKVLGNDGVFFFKKAFAWNRRRDGFSSWDEMVEHPIFNSLRQHKKSRKYAAISRAPSLLKSFKPPRLSHELKSILRESLRISGFNLMPWYGFSRQEVQEILENFPLLSNYQIETRYAVQMGRRFPDPDEYTNDTETPPDEPEPGFKFDFGGDIEPYA